MGEGEGEGEMLQVLCTVARIRYLQEDCELYRVAGDKDANS